MQLLMLLTLTDGSSGAAVSQTKSMASDSSMRSDRSYREPEDAVAADPLAY